MQPHKRWTQSLLVRAALAIACAATTIHCSEHATQLACGAGTEQRGSVCVAVAPDATSPTDALSPTCADAANADTSDGGPNRDANDGSALDADANDVAMVIDTGTDTSVDATPPDVAADVPIADATDSGTDATSQAQLVAEYPIPSTFGLATSIVMGPDGNLWFTAGNTVGRATPSGTFTAFDVPPFSGGAASTAVVSILNGPDGNLWMSQYGSSERLVAMATDGTIAMTVPISGADAFGGDMILGPDGNFWVSHNSAVDRISPTGTVAQFAPSDTSYFLDAIAVGPDGNLWFTEVNYSPDSLRIGRITVAGALSEFDVSGSLVPTYAAQWGIGAGVDGNLWFRFYPGIARITTDGVVTQLSLPRGGEPALFASSGSMLWFADEMNRIGSIDASGAISEIPLLATPTEITVGRDGNVWFLEVGPGSQMYVTEVRP